MIWQDVVLGLGGFVFSVAMIPTIRGKEKPALTTGILTAAVLTTFVVAYISLQLWLAATTTFLTMTTWYIVTIQKYMQIKKQ